MGTRGVILQTVPEEVAQAAEYLAQRHQLPVDLIIKAGISMMVSMEQQGDPRFAKFMDMVKADTFKTSPLDRVLA